MLGEQKLKQIARKVLSLSSADETEVLLFVSENALTRFANSQIHQNVIWEDIGISVRVVFGKKIGVSSVNSFESRALEKAVNDAQALAKLQKEDRDFVSLPKPQKLPEIKAKVARTTEVQRARSVQTIIKRAKENRCIASGAFSSTVSEIAVANSHGVWAYFPTSASDLSTILLGEDSSGFASQVGKEYVDIDAEQIARAAAAKVVRGAHPIEIKPGEWDVLLEPQAVNEMMVFFSWLGPNARIYYEQASCLSGLLGKKVFGNNISIVDDPLDKDSFPMPFDFEGVPKRRTEIIKNGYLKNLVNDSYYANRYRKKNTGHALPAPNTNGPIPLHLMIEPGVKDRSAMVKSIKKGLLITRFWYVRVLNPKQLSLTGMTRDGTFLIENGEIVAGVKNLRFNQSVPEALNNVVAVGNKVVPLSSFETEIGINRMPHLHIKNWHFTSTTLF